MPMPVIALVGSASYAMKRPGTKLASKSSLWLMATLCLMMVLMAQNGSFAPPARSRTTLNVSLVRQNNRSIPKDGHLPAHLMSVKEKETKWITLSTTDPRYPRSINQATIWSLFSNFLPAEKWRKQSFPRRAKEEKTANP